jgi:hypothetical protein
VPESYCDRAELFQVNEKPLLWMLSPAELGCKQFCMFNFEDQEKGQRSALAYTAM